MFVTNWISTTKIQKISEITNFFRHYFLSRTEVVVEQSSIQKCSKLNENIFVLKHSSQFFLAAKLQNQVRFIAKYCIKDYNSTVLKIELPFFIGQ